MVKTLKYIDKFLKFLKTDRNTFFTYILTLLSIYFVVDRLVEVLFMIFTGISISYWHPIMYTVALACPVFAFLFCYGSKFIKSNTDKLAFFNLYVIALYIITVSMVIQYINAALWIGLMSVPNYRTIVMDFPELIRPAFSAIAFYLPLITVPAVFKFLHSKVGDTRLLQESIWDYGGIKLTTSKEGIGAYSCEMYLTLDKETGKKAIIPENSRFYQLLVVGPSGSGKTSLIFEPMIARDIDKKFFFRNIAKEMGYTAVKTGIATLNCPYTNEYINENFNLNMITPVDSKLDLYKAYMKNMILNSSGTSYTYKNLGLTYVSPDYETISRMLDVAKCYNMHYNLVDPNNPNSIGLNPFAYDNPLQTAGVITSVLKSMYQSTVENVEKVYMENAAVNAIENLCVFLKGIFPTLHSGDKDYLPNLEDLLNIFSNFDILEEMCNKIEQENPNLLEKYKSQVFYFKNHFFKDGKKRTETEKYVQYATNTINSLLEVPGVKTILCNRTENVNYDNALANGEITFVCTRRGDLGGTVHKSFGLFFLLLMQNAVLRRPGSESTRVPHFLYIDEFPEFLSTSTEAIFTLYRKYRVGTTISSQTLAQLGNVNEKYKQTILSNCINKVAFGNNTIEENEWWSKEFGNVRYWKFSNTYDTAKGEYDSKYGGIEWAWKSKYAPDKIRSITFKNCAFKYRTNTGGIFVGEGKLDFLQPKYKEKKQEKFYNFDKITKGISHEEISNKKSKSSHLSHDSGEESNPIMTDTSDLNLFDNDDAIIFNLKKNKNN